MNPLAETLAGRFLVIDGPDGAGKTTQLERLENSLAAMGLTVTRAVDPGGTLAGQRIRDILLHSDDLDLAPMCETMLFMASRAQLAEQVIRPAMRAGHVVLCDRYISATIAYQGALGVDPQRIIDLGRLATGDLWPDLTVVLDLDSGDGLGRLGPQRDRMERRPDDYHQAVRTGFVNLPSVYPAPVVPVDATGDVDTVARRLLNTLEQHLTP